MRVRTQKVNIESQNFVLIEDTQNGKHFFGTIPYTELDENGCMKRALNGFQMCVRDTIPEAIACRKQSVIFENWCNAHPEATETEKIQFLVDTI